MRIDNVDSIRFCSKPTDSLTKLIKRSKDISLEPVKSYTQYMKVYGEYINKNLKKDKASIGKKT